MTCLSCVRLHKTGTGYKEIVTHLKMLISTVWAILKNIKATGIVTKLPGRGHVYFDPMHSADEEKHNIPE